MTDLEKNLSLRISKELHRKIKVEAALRDQGMSEFIRALAASWIDENGSGLVDGVDYSIEDED